MATSLRRYFVVGSALFAFSLSAQADWYGPGYAGDPGANAYYNYGGGPAPYYPAPPLNTAATAMPFICCNRR